MDYQNPKLDSLPLVLQGGMGIYVFPASAAKEASMHGAVGTVSGTGMHLVLPRLLQLGDQGGDFRRALQSFPDQEMANRILHRFFVPEGIPNDKPFQRIEHFSLNPSRELIELTIVANFCQVWLAKENNSGLIGINFLEKVQMPHLYALYGALLAGVDYLFIGAGIPMQISGVLDRLIMHEPATYITHVIGGNESVEYASHFNPRDFIHQQLPELKRPLFYVIIGSSTIAWATIKSGDLKIDGWVAEKDSAGGHSMRPRGKMTLTDTGEPIYGIRDEMNLKQLEEIGLPFYLAGGYASPKMLNLALEQGASGVQVGTIFGLSDESKINPILRAYIRKEGYNGRLVVFNDPQASPTGFPFKVVHIPGTLGDKRIFANRRQICEMGGLLQPYLRKDGNIGYRCPAEPLQSYLAKGGRIEDTINTMCLCSGLHATVDLGQRLSHGTSEPAVVTMGQDVAFLRRLMSHENDGYSIEAVMRYLLNK